MKKDVFKVQDNAILKDKSGLRILLISSMKPLTKLLPIWKEVHYERKQKGELKSAIAKF